MSVTEVFVAVAFLKQAGARELGGALEAVLDRGGTARIFVGTDFFLTTPDALETLLELAEHYPQCQLKVGARAKNTFHPKVYAGFRQDGFECLTGSANLTAGALEANIEASVRVNGPEDHPFKKQLERFFRDLEDECRYSKLSRVGLLRYRALWKPVEAKRRALEKAVKHAEHGLEDIDTLGEFYAAYRRDADNISQVEERLKNRSKAKKVQRQIARLLDVRQTPSQLRAALKPLLNDLMSWKDDGRHLWPSDSIFRKGAASADRPRETIELFAAAFKAVRKPVDKGFAEVRDLALSIPGVGTNMVTEILCTLRPDVFPVFNGNTRSAMAKFGLTFQGAHDLTSMTPARYAVIVSMLSAVTNEIGASDFAETDAFLNWVYQTTKK